MIEGKFRVGDRVRWNTSGGGTVGRVVRVATESGRIKDYVYDASPDSPRYIVETEDGRPAAHRAEALERA